MKRRTILFIAITALLVLAFVQVSLVSAEECIGEDCGYVPPDDDFCQEGDECAGEPDPDPPVPYCPEGECEETPPVEEEDECAFGNPGNAKCVGKAGEKDEMGGFYPPTDPPTEGYDGTHGRSDPAKHKKHPSMP